MLNHQLCKTGGGVFLWNYHWVTEQWDFLGVRKWCSAWSGQAPPSSNPRATTKQATRLMRPQVQGDPNMRRDLSTLGAVVPGGAGNGTWSYHERPNCSKLLCCWWHPQIIRRCPMKWSLRCIWIWRYHIYLALFGIIWQTYCGTQWMLHVAPTFTACWDVASVAVHYSRARKGMRQ